MTEGGRIGKDTREGNMRGMREGIHKGDNTRGDAGA